MLVSKTILTTLWDSLKCTRYFLVRKLLNTVYFRWRVIAAAQPLSRSLFLSRTVHHYPRKIRETLAKERAEAAVVKEELPPLVRKV